MCATAADLTAMEPRAARRARGVAGVVRGDDDPRGAAASEHYGFGLQVERTPWGTPIIQHGGSTTGFLAENGWFPAESLSVTILYNSSPGPDASALLPQVARIALGRSLANAAPLASADAPPTGVAALAKLVGEYEIATGVTITIARRERPACSPRRRGDRRARSCRRPGGCSASAAAAPR